MKKVDEESGPGPLSSSAFFDFFDKADQVQFVSLYSISHTEREKVHSFSALWYNERVVHFTKCIENWSDQFEDCRQYAICRG
jgi:hypothetical protein